MSQSRPNKPAIVKIKGGLGNQLFQYAFGRSINLATGREVIFDRSHYDQFKNRKFLLDKFNVSGQFVSLSPSKFEKIITQSMRLAHIDHLLHVKTDSKTDNELNLISHNLNWNVFDGYWQSLYFFQPYLDTIRMDLRPKQPSGHQYIPNEEKEMTISIHIRRGDYVTDTKNQSIYHECTHDYYRKSIEYFKDQFGTKIKFLVFSDDINWCKKNIKSNLDISYIDPNENDPTSDFFLMNSCHHHIIANSTFSWWSAVLNSSPNCTVIAPHFWYKNQKMSSKLLPNNWIQL